jgi:transposase
LRDLSVHNGAIWAITFREIRTFDGLALAVRERLGEDPQSGALFVFINKRANRLKALWFDRNGFCILYKRVHRAMFVPPTSTDPERPLARVDAQELARLFAGVDKPPRTRLRWS